MYLVELLDVLAWPGTVIFLGWYYRENLRELVLKHDDTELRLKTRRARESREKARFETAQLESILDSLPEDERTQAGKKELVALRDSIDELYSCVETGAASGRP